jgi:hypothetical protein
MLISLPLLMNILLEKDQSVLLEFARTEMRGRFKPNSVAGLNLNRWLVSTETCSGVIAQLGVTITDSLCAVGIFTS